MAIDKVGQSISKGFYVPSSQSSSYVASKRNDEGSYEYTSRAQDIGLQRRAALQDLSEQYGDVVENAYASYLANQRTINASAMGQGYKDAYEQMQQQNLVNQVAQAGLSAANARQQIDESALKAREQLDEQFALETTNLDKVGTQLDNYFEYLKTLMNDANQNYLQAMGIKYDENTKGRDIYNELYTAAPYTYTGEGENRVPTFVDPNTQGAGMSFFDYVNANIGDKKADTDWRDWLFYNKGWNEYVDALNKSKEVKPYIAQRNEELEKTKDELKLDDVITKSIIDNNSIKVDNKEFVVNESGRLEGSKLDKVYNYYKNINKPLQVGDVITVDGEQYIYTNKYGDQYKGLYKLEELPKPMTYREFIRSRESLRYSPNSSEAGRQQGYQRYLADFNSKK